MPPIPFPAGACAHCAAPITDKSIVCSFTVTRFVSAKLGGPVVQSHTKHFSSISCMLAYMVEQHLIEATIMEGTIDNPGAPVHAAPDAPPPPPPEVVRIHDAIDDFMSDVGVTVDPKRIV